MSVNNDQAIIVPSSKIQVLKCVDGEVPIHNETFVAFDQQSQNVMQSELPLINNETFNASALIASTEGTEDRVVRELQLPINENVVFYRNEDLLDCTLLGDALVN